MSSMLFYTKVYMNSKWYMRLLIDPNSSLELSFLFGLNPNN